MEDDEFELLSRRLADQVAEKVEKDLKKRYAWLGVVALVFTGSTISLLVDKYMSDTRISLLAAEEVQRNVTDTLRKASDSVVGFAEQADEIRRTLVTDSQEAQANYSDVFNRAERVAEELAIANTNSLDLVSTLDNKISTISSILSLVVEEQDQQNITEAGQIAIKQLEDISNSIPNSSAQINAATDRMKSFEEEFSDPWLGVWAIEKWETDGGTKYGGTISITDRISENSLIGKLFTSGVNGAEIVEDLQITTESDSVTMIGSIADSVAFWSPDNFYLKLEGNRMIGTNVDSSGTKGEVIFTKTSVIGK